MTETRSISKESTLSSAGVKLLIEQRQKRDDKIFAASNVIIATGITIGCIGGLIGLIVCAANGAGPGMVFFKAVVIPIIVGYGISGLTFLWMLSYAIHVYVQRKKLDADLERLKENEAYDLQSRDIFDFTASAPFKLEDARR